MAALASTSFLPKHIAEGIITETRAQSTVAKLAGADPMLFGSTDYLVFNNLPKAEFVEEGADKGHSPVGFTTVTAKPHKAQVTMRFNQEVQWADEDYQLGVLTQLASAGATALSRALDLGIYHRINPLTGTAVEALGDYVGETSKTVEQNTADADADIKSAVGLLVSANIPVTGLALDPKQAWALANLEVNYGGAGSGQPRYPQLGLGTNIDTFLGVPTAVSDTVSGLPEAKADTKIRAIAGDFRDGLRWGIQKDIPVELIQFGDPDGQGDLKRKNQIALRLEIVYGWFVRPASFAVVKAKGEAA